MKEIVQKIRFESERKMILNFLDSLELKIFDPNTNLTEYINSQADENFKDLIRAYFSDLEPEKVLSKIKELRNELENVNRIVLTVNFDADSSTIDIVKNYLSKDQDKPVIIEFVKDPSIIGGASIENDGYIFEHSFRNYFEKRREAKNGL